LHDLRGSDITRKIFEWLIVNIVEEEGYWISSNLNSTGIVMREWCGCMLRKIEFSQKSTKLDNFIISRRHSSILRLC
jgi:hypothetical protein